MTTLYNNAVEVDVSVKAVVNITLTGFLSILNHNHNIKLYSFKSLFTILCLHKYENQLLAVVFAYRDLEVSRDL